MLRSLQISTRWMRKNSPLIALVWFWALLAYAFVTWKMAIDADPHGHRFVLLGSNLSGEMYQVSCFTARMSAALMQFLGLDVFARNDLLYLKTGYQVIVIWGCTALKELYIFLMIMLLYCGPVRAKLWYTPLCLVVLYLYNLLRIGLIPWLAGNGYYTFDFWHEVFRISYYGLIFLLWVGWNEHFVSKQFIRLRLKRLFNGGILHQVRRRWF